MEIDQPSNGLPDTNVSLRELFGVDGEQAIIASVEYGQIYLLQLESPLLADLQASGLILKTPVAVPEQIVTFRDALMNSAVPLELLILIKAFARQHRNDGTLPPSVAGALYYLAIAAALVHCGRFISSLNASVLDEGLQRIELSEWVDESMRSIARSARTLARRRLP